MHRCIPLFFLLVAATTAEPAADDCLIADRQDLAMMQAVWTKEVQVDARGSRQQIIAALAKRSGIAISSSDAAPKQKQKQEHGSGSRSIPGMIAPRLRAIARRWLDAGVMAALEIEESGKLDYVGSTYHLSMPHPLPLGLVLEELAAATNCVVSYRPKGPHLAAWRELMPEIAVTRSFLIAHPWGSIQDSTHNGELRHIRLNLLDSCAAACVPWISAGCSDMMRVMKLMMEPTGAHVALRALEPSIVIAFDAGSGRLSWTAPPFIIDNFVGFTLPRLDIPSPEEAHSEALRIACERMRKPAEIAWAALAPPAQLVLEGHVRTLLGSDAAGAERARLALIKSLPASAAPILATIASDTSGRLEKVLIDADGAMQLPGLRASVARYFALGVAGDVAAIREECWSKERLMRDRAHAESFAAARERAGSDPKALANICRNYGLPLATPPSGINYDAVLRLNLAVSPALVSVHLSGNHAEIHYTLSAPAINGSPRKATEFMLVCENGRWVADVERPMDDPDAYTWRDSGTADVPMGGSTVEAIHIGNKMSLTGSAWAEAVSSPY